jgi:GT2 family glycosyltransferase
MSASMGLSLVIVTWNAKAHALSCLASLVHQSVDNLEIVVVDNASSDGTADAIAARFPTVRLLRNTTNMGFAAANNIGIRTSTKDTLCLINSDVTVPPGCLSRMRSFLDNNPDIGLIGPVMMGPSGERRRSTMRFPTVWNAFSAALCLDFLLARCRLGGGFMMKDFDHAATRDVDILNGWFWMARRSALDDVGLLDERFFFYAEDLDWCRRFHINNWRVVFYHEVSAVHYGGASSSVAPVHFYVEMQRANLQYWFKHHGRLGLITYALALTLHHVIRVVAYGAYYFSRRQKSVATGHKVQRAIASLRHLWSYRSFDQLRDPF